MLDQFQRQIQYMRVSITDRCNYRCMYCMPEQGVEKLSHDNIISFEELFHIVQAGVELGIKKVRITGGEPLVRKGVTEFVRLLSSIKEIEDLSMTTNAALLAPMAKELKQAGLHRVNISMDSLQPEKFHEITRCGSLQDAFNGLDAALSCGLMPVKINTVLIGGFNDDEIADFVALTEKLPIEIRFIELMPIGSTNSFGEEAYLPVRTVLQRVPQLQPEKSAGGVAKRYRLPGAPGTVGLISPISNAFCSSCNRIRITADGKIKPCLHSAEEYSIRGLEHDALVRTLQKVIYEKPICHEPLSREQPSKASRGMNGIGG